MEFRIPSYQNSAEIRFIGMMGPLRLCVCGRDLSQKVWECLFGPLQFGKLSEAAFNFTVSVHIFSSSIFLDMICSC